MIEYSDACEIFSFISNSSSACDACDYLNKTTKSNCDTCLGILGVRNTGVREYWGPGEYINEAAWNCFVSNPTVHRCDPEADASHAELAACVRKECEEQTARPTSEFSRSYFSSCFPMTILSHFSAIWMMLIAILVMVVSTMFCWYRYRPKNSFGIRGTATVIMDSSSRQNDMELIEHDTFLPRDSEIRT